MICLQAICGCRARSSSDTRVAASPTISRRRTNARQSTRLAWRSARVVFCTSAAASRAWSSMCRSPMASSCCVIQYLGLFQDGIPEIPAEKLRGIEVYLPSDDVGQLHFHVKKCQTWHMAWLKLDEDINVTIRAEIIAQDRAEQR